MDFSGRQGHQFGYTILGSGSGGNATVIHCPDGGAFLLDAGFTAKELTARMTLAGIDPESISAILITHEHIDHIRGCRVFADKLKIPVYVTANTCKVLANLNALPEKKVLFSPGCPFTLHGVTVEPFSVSHDVVDGVAFVFRAGRSKLGFATDLGHLNLLASTKLHGCTALVIESNYDPTALKNSGRPLNIVRRIMGRHGHLSNEDAMASLTQLLTEETRALVFAHISRECNNPDIVFQMAEESLAQLNRLDLKPCIACQEHPLATCWLN